MRDYIRSEADSSICPTPLLNRLARGKEEAHRVRPLLRALVWLVVALMILAGCEGMTPAPPNDPPGPEGTWLVTAFEHADYVIHTDEIIRDYTIDELELLAGSDVLLTLEGGNATAKCVPKCYHRQLDRELEVILEADYSVSMRGGIRVVIDENNELYSYTLWGKYEVSDDGTIYFKLNSSNGDTVSSVTQLWGTSEFRLGEHGSGPLHPLGGQPALTVPRIAYVLP